MPWWVTVPALAALIVAVGFAALALWVRQPYAQARAAGIFAVQRQHIEAEIRERKAKVDA